MSIIDDPVAVSKLPVGSSANSSEGSVENAKKDEKVIESYLGRGSKLEDKN